MSHCGMNNAGHVFLAHKCVLDTKFLLGTLLAYNDFHRTFMVVCERQAVLMVSDASWKKGKCRLACQLWSRGGLDQIARSAIPVRPDPTVTF